MYVFTVSFFEPNNAHYANWSAILQVFKIYDMKM
jgi:hypothetical protein